MLADNPGTADDDAFNMMPVVPDVKAFHQEIKQACDALSSAEQAMVVAINRLRDEVVRRLPLPEAPEDTQGFTS